MLKSKTFNLFHSLPCLYAVLQIPPAGSVSVGKIVAKAAAENLTPVTLELGGKCPVIVDENTNIDTAAKRIIWGKVRWF